jgi:glyoxylase-like metal-dependent hydrolase (beta-lactamase superfamily II)
MAKQVADGVVQLGTEWINWFLVEDGGAVTVVDAAVPGYRPQLDEGLRLLGRSPSDVSALILTHAHGDHVGCAEKIRTELGVPVYVHEQDKELATTAKAFGKNESSLLPYLRYRSAWRFLVHGMQNGAAKPVKIGEVTTFTGDDTLEVPGRPKVIHTPGHTMGHVTFLFEGHGVLMLGDLLMERNVLTGSRGPQLPPRAFNLSSPTMLDSLTKIEDRNETLLFGHGDPWTTGAAAAVAEARRRGTS